MKSLIKNVLISSSLLLVLTACSEPVQKKLITVNAQMESNELANAGEQLMVPQSLHLANKVFEMALAKDPANKKARFYHTFLKRVMIFEGIVPRIQPYVDKYGEPEVFAKRLKEIPNGPARQFLLKKKDDAELIKNVADIQKLLLEYRKAAEDFRSFVIENADINLELYLNPNFFQDIVEQNKWDACEIKEDSNGWEMTCDPSEIETVKVNMADLLVLKQMAAGDIIYATGATSYSFGTIDELIKKSANMTPEAIGESAKQTKDFGLLMKSQGLTAIRSLGSDLSVGMKWAIKYQESLCKRDEYGRMVARRGFLTKDICVDTVNANKSVQVLDSVLAGIINAPVELRDGSTTTTDFNIMVLLDKPIFDLRMVMPTLWIEEGQRPKEVPDASIGGLLPKADANTLLEKIK
ncbi:hypothetical protein [Bdellovibrio bacteriovorus]|nr:hypothetical protein [Bdellovibrio bacteriovorus]